jgi:uncharacterized protein YegP (UPF0339 family)
VHYVIYRDTRNYWRWRLIASNGKVIADSAESYVNKQDCLHGIALVKSSSSAPVWER